MMKFEKPIMNISMFEMENVVTTASEAAADIASTQVDGKIAALGENVEAAKIIIAF